MRSACAVLVLLCACREQLPVGVEHSVMRDGMRLCLFEKRPGAGLMGRRPAEDRVVLLLHGATWSGRPDFDLQIRDYSLMDALARAGHDAFALDIHGYGCSQGPLRPDDFATADEAIKDVAAAVRYIKDRRRVASLSLFGWSWGAHVAGLYAARHKGEVDRLVLYGFFPVRPRRTPRAELPQALYRDNRFEDTQGDFIEGEFEEDVARRFGEEALAACPRSPSGVIIDFRNRMPLFLPEEIGVPTLLLYGVYDLMPPHKQRTLPPAEFAAIEGRCLEFFGKLGTRDRRYVVVPGGGHAVHLERGHRIFQRALLDYLAQGKPEDLASGATAR